ncbi:MAG: hypothetical protein ABFQ62_03160 [Patescibacteria group bacterium]
MKEEFIKHKIAYIVLALGLVIIGILFFAVWPSRDWQRVVALVLTLFYFLWGVITHLKADHITRLVIMEYLGVAIMAGFLLVLITL